MSGLVLRTRLLPLFPLLAACNGIGEPVGAEVSSGGQSTQSRGGALNTNESETSSPGGAGGDTALLWSAPREVIVPVLGYEDQDPFVSEDGLTLYFQSMRPTTFAGPNLWQAVRVSTDVPWGEPTLVDGINSDNRAANPVLSKDELHLWFAYSDGDDYEIYESTRPTKTDPWLTPTILSGLGGDPHGVAPSLTADELVMYLNRAGDDLDVDIYRATRASKNDVFGVPEPLSGLNSSDADWDVFSRDDLVFAFGRGGVLYRASRAGPTDDFGPITPLVDSASATFNYDPWVSADGNWVVYASDNGGPSRIREVRRE